MLSTGHAFPTAYATPGHHVEKFQQFQPGAMRWGLHHWLVVDSF